MKGFSGRSVGGAGGVEGPRGRSAQCHILTFRSITPIRGRFHLRPDSERNKNTNTWKRVRRGACACAHPRDAGYSLIISVRRRIACPTEHISPSPFSISAFLHSERNFNFMCVAAAAAAFSGPSAVPHYLGSVSMATATEHFLRGDGF